MIRFRDMLSRQAKVVDWVYLNIGGFGSIHEQTFAGEHNNVQLTASVELRDPEASPKYKGTE